MSIYDKPEGVYVVIKNWRTKEVGSVMGPMSGRRADRVENGALMRVDIDSGWGVDVTETLGEPEQEFLAKEAKNGSTN